MFNFRHFKFTLWPWPWWRSPSPAYFERSCHILPFSQDFITLLLIVSEISVNVQIFHILSWPCDLDSRSSSLACFERSCHILPFSQAFITLLLIVSKMSANDQFFNIFSWSCDIYLDPRSSSHVCFERSCHILPFSEVLITLLLILYEILAKVQFFTIFSWPCDPPLACFWRSCHILPFGQVS